MTVSPLGFIRDCFGIARPVASDAQAAIASGATSFSMPAPGGGA
jgi:hypothetical protein